MIKCNVSNVAIEITETETLTAGRVGLECQFTFSSEWNGLAITAYFLGETTNAVVVNGNTVVVPAASMVAPGYKLYVGVVGRDAQGNIVIPTLWASAGKIKTSPGEEEEPTPSPDVVAQIQLMAINAVNTANAAMQVITDHYEEIEEVGAEQVAAVNAAGTTQTGNVNTAGAAQLAAIQAKGEEVLETIPEDYTELSNDVDDLKSSINNSQTTYGFAPAELKIEFENGSFDSSTGAESTSSNRARSKDFLPDYLTSISTFNAVGQIANGFLLYAWENGTTYIGFWGGNGFVKSGSVYLRNLDLVSFRENYPTYKFRIVTALSSGQTYVSAENQCKAINENSVLIQTDSIKDETSDVFEDVNKNLALAAIKTDILTNKIPYHRGFLFHKLQNNDNSLWYGSSFDNIKKIGVVDFNPTLMRMAISPTDGRIIAAERDNASGLYIFDGKVTTRISTLSPSPYAWLYNSGVDFINYDGQEYCIFAEYWSTRYKTPLNVWRGKYPYTSASDWEIVFSLTSAHLPTDSGEISHFHMVKRDPWTNILYLTSGDSDDKSKWWYSTDGGATWTLLVSGATSGWNNSLCRTINFVFTADYIYWATDHGEAGANHHTLNRISRNAQTGIIDISTKEQLSILPQLYATNSLCYVESPNGLFMYDRIDENSAYVFGQPIKMLFWSFADEELKEIASIKLTSSTWGGNRGKCYVNYTNSKQPYPAMGFSIDTPCAFDIVCDDPANIGTIVYGVGDQTIRTVDY